MAAKNRVGPTPEKVKGAATSQLWLSLLEDATKVEWPPTIEGQSWRVFLSTSDSLQGCNHSGLYRTSPVFPVSPDFSAPDFPGGVYYLYFFCFDPAFPVLGRLLQKAPKELTAGLLYTTGLASVLLIAKRLALADDLEQRCLYQGIKLDDSLLRSSLLIALSALMMGSRRGSVKRVVTFNFDSVLEWYISLYGFVPRVVVQPPVDEGAEDVRIYHPHGFLPHPGLHLDGSNFVILGLKSINLRLGKPHDDWVALLLTYSRAA